LLAEMNESRFEPSPLEFELNPTNHLHIEYSKLIV
jgi:hypothetical protein